MNNFNNVFMSIKKFCGEEGFVDGDGVLENIAGDTGIPVSRLTFMLNTLQDLQLIKYSPEGRYIKLTAFGKRQERLFTDNEH